uniref:FAD-linked oxidase C-terminal domain-containing protein n=1 Tax=Sphingobium abikonense TaxID=86193 RepID=UPI00351228DE
DVAAHTRAHLAFVITADADPAVGPLVFSGDTLFAGGCGRLFEGSASDMHTALQRLTALPAETKVCCAHEYTEANLRWAVEQRPDDSTIAARLEDVRQRRSRGELSLPSSIALERATNLFLQADTPDVLRHGTMRALVDGLEAVLPDGSIFDGLDALKKDNRGYDIKQLLIGAEGTLGIVTAASLRLVPAIATRAVGWAGVDSPEQALHLLRLTEKTLGDSVEGFEVIADDTLGFVLGHIPGTRSPIETRTPWHVLIEVDHADLADPGPGERLEGALAQAMEQGIVIDAAIAANEAQAEAFWRIRESLSESERAQGPALQYDISVPVAKMPAFMVEAAEAAEAAFPGTTASSFGHLGDGNVHFHVRAPKGTSDGPAWIAAQGQAINAFVHDAVVAAGGSISAEHGIGQMKRAELARLSSPARIAALRAIKTAFDPQGLFNPGKLIPLPEEG